MKHWKKMKIIVEKELILALIALLLINSCVDSKINEKIDKGILNETTSKVSLNNDYKYIINIDSNKIHTYFHGNNVIRNEKHKLKTNKELMELLRNEKYDICHICYAGLNVREVMKKFNHELIEKYMRLYEFINYDFETCEFLMSIFEVGNWYVNNIYTYQGGLNTVSKINMDAKNFASYNAQKNWEAYKASYSELKKVDKDIVLDNKKILSTTFSGNKAMKYSLYKCDIFKTNFAKGDSDDAKINKKVIKNADNEILGYDYKNYYVSDDCSKFAAAVYYHYINKTILKNKPKDEKDGMGIDLWYTGTYGYTKDKSMYNILVNTNKFEFYGNKEIKEYNKMYDKGKRENEFKLEVGDLIYRKEKAHYENKNGKKISVSDIPGHVEFYIGNDKVVSWGKINKNNVSKKVFVKDKINNCFYSDNIIEDKKQPFVSIIRFKRGIYEK